MSGFLTPEELRKLKPAETLPFASPIPTQVVSSDEYYPAPQNKKQREVEARVKALGNELARKQGISRRAFFTTAAGMAAAFLAMNEVYGGVFDVTAAEAATPELAQERANSFKDQFIFDGHTHFLRDDTRLNSFVANAPGGRRRRLESRDEGQEADHRGSEVQQLLQGDLPR